MAVYILRNKLGKVYSHYFVLFVLFSATTSQIRNRWVVKINRKTKVRVGKIGKGKL